MKAIDLIKIASHLFRHDNTNKARMEIYQVADHKHGLDTITHDFSPSTTEVIKDISNKFKQAEIKAAIEKKKAKRRKR